MSHFALRVRLDPAPGQRAQLAAYPADALWPDFAVVTSGALAIDLGNHAVAYRNGQLVPLPAGADDPAAWLPDYLGGFLPRLAAAVIHLRPGTLTSAHLLDAPARLTFAQARDEASVVVGYHDLDQTIYTATLPPGAVRAVVAATLADFLAQLLTINPRLARQPDVRELRRSHKVLRAHVRSL
jgi:hypothetical protein